MRKLFLFAIAAAFSLPLAAQQPKQDEKQEQKDQPQQSEAAKERVRVDGAAGGTAPVPPEKRAPVNAGAGPHLRDTLPSPQKLPRDEPVRPPNAEADANANARAKQQRERAGLRARTHGDINASTTDAKAKP